MIKKFKIKNQLIGEGCPPYLIAEVGINHNGSLRLAKQTILAAHEAGANAVKIQTFKATSLCAENSKYYHIFKNCELSENQLYKLYDFAKKKKNKSFFHSF